MIDKIQGTLNNLNWTSFKTIIDDRNLHIQYIEINDMYYLSAFDSHFRIGCMILKVTPTPDPSDQKEFEDNYESECNERLEERGTIKLAKGEIEANSENSGIATILVKVPGTPGSVDGRFIDGGTSWFESGDMGDWLEIHTSDEDNILGYGAGFIVGSYTDTDVDSANQGWYLKPGEMTFASRITKHGWIPSGLYLKVVGHKVSGGTLPDTMFINIAWGKRC